MRLIDTDKIVYCVEADDDGNVIRPAQLDEYVINGLPTVNAVPVRWIKVWGRRHNQKELIKQLLDDWREFKK